MNFNIVNSIKDVPKQWIYYHYLGVKQPMDGRTIRMRSFVNSDTTPSLYLYVKDGTYKWKDFSSGYQGSAIDMVMIMNPGINYSEACLLIIKDYNFYVSKNGLFVSDKVETSITDYTLKAEYEVRNWNKTDRDFWLFDYGITTARLNHYNVRPIKWYQLSKVYDTHNKVYNVVQHERMYGYFTNEGQLYAIYQPDYRDLKFIKLFPYIHGFDQLRREYNTLIIGSGLKDILVIESMDLSIETIAPMSETTLLSLDEINTFKADYKYIFTLLDNDRAGIQAMRRYKELYNIEPIYFLLDKDVADARRNSGYDKTRQELIISINKKLQTCNSQLMVL